MKYAKDILEGTKDTVKTEYKLTSLAQGTLTGAIAGAMIGLTVAYFKGYTWYKSAVIGTLAGGVLSKIFIIKK